MLFLAATGFALFNVIFSQLLGRPRPNPAKSAVYECGVPSVAKLSERFPIKFYLVAMLFILFDVEVVFLYPWATVYRQMLADAALRNTILFSMLSFIGVLFIGYFYALKKGAFNWKR